MSKGKRWLGRLAVLTTLLSLLLLEGCSYMSTTPTPAPTLVSREEVKQRMLDHLAEKYGEEFESYSVEYRSAMQNYELMLAYPKKGGDPTRTFALMGYGPLSGISYRDNYIGYLLADDLEAKAQTVLEHFFPDSIVLIGTWATYYPECFTKDTPRDVIIDYQTKKHGIAFVAFTSLPPELVSTVETLPSQIVTELESIIATGSLRLTTVPQEDWAQGVAEWNARYEEQYPMNAPFPSGLYPNQHEWPLLEWGSFDPTHEYSC
jgi:hypothetical protein